MSEMQTEYESDAGPTQGPWRAGWFEDRLLVDVPHSESTELIAEMCLARDNPITNAQLIAAAGTAAQKAKLLGYHPVDAIRSMPGLIVALEEIADGHEEPQTVARHALKSVEGSDDE